MKHAPLCTLIFLLAFACSVPRYACAEEKSSCRERASEFGGHAFTENDVGEEVLLGREIAARILGQYHLSPDMRLQKYVSLVGMSLAANANRPELAFRFAVVVGKEINAYSTPGGYIFITTGAIRQMENEAELAGVLAHEITHIAERHIVNELNVRGSEKTLTSFISGLTGGATKSGAVAFSQVVDKAIDIILRDGYGREEEIQADRIAVLYCALAGYDPEGLITYLDKVGKIKGNAGKSYPVYDLRLGILQQTINDEGIEAKRLALHQERFAATVTKTP